MITHLLKSINWIDVALVCVFVRIIFSGVKDGLVAEFFKSLGIVLAVFVSLHYYAAFAAWVTLKTHLTWHYWELVIFALLWLAIVVIFKFIKDGVLFLFKIETTHQGFDKYAAGVVAVGRALLVSSMTIFLILLIHHGFLTRMAFHSYGYKIAGRADVMTYSFLYNNLVNKLFAIGHFNAAAALLLHPLY